MLDKSVISVIVPVYNVKKYLQKCINSIINQKFTKLEIILVDDGSTDGSGEMCDEYAQKDNRIIVIHKPNGGLSDARNRGIDIATGNFISFVDSDDFIFPDYFSYLYELIISNNADISVCQLTYVDENDQLKSLGGVAVDKVVCGNDKCMEAFVNDTAIDTPAWRKLYKKSLFSDRIRYPKGRLHEDVFTTYLLIAHSNTIAVGSKPLYAYRQRIGSIVNSKFSPRHLDAVIGNIERYNFISSNYPSLDILASKGILHAANVCVMRMGKSKVFTGEYVKFLQSKYRKYLWKYLKSNCRVASRLFAVVAALKLSWLIRFISITSKQKSI